MMVALSQTHLDYRYVCKWTAFRNCKYSNSNPNYSFAGDTNTGIGTTRPTGDTLTIVTGGTERVRIHSSGHVSINGTDNASADGLSNLTVGSGSGDAGISIYSGTSSSARLMFADGTSGGAQYDGFVDYNHSNQSLGLGTGSYRRKRLNY